MKKQGLLAVVVVLLIGVLFWWVPQQTTSKEGQKEITVTIEDQTKEQTDVVLEKVFHTDAKTLTEFLETNKDLKVKTEQSTYGTLLMEIYGLKQDMEQGPWLVYGSENNQACQESGMCPALDQVTIDDGDAFTFSLISAFE